MTTTTEVPKPRAGVDWPSLVGVNAIFVSLLGIMVTLMAMLGSESLIYIPALAGCVVIVVLINVSLIKEVKRTRRQIAYLKRLPPKLNESRPRWRWN